MMTRDGEPLAAEEDATPSTGDALLNQALAFCAAKGMALPLDPEPLAALCPYLWANAKAVKNWKAGVAVAVVLKRGPPADWRLAEYRHTSRRGGRPAVAWVPAGIEPRAAIAKTLGEAEAAIALKESPWQKTGAHQCRGSRPSTSPPCSRTNPSMWGSC